MRENGWSYFDKKSQLFLLAMDWIEAILPCPTFYLWLVVSTTKTLIKATPPSPINIHADKLQSVPVIQKAPPDLLAPETALESTTVGHNKGTVLPGAEPPDSVSVQKGRLTAFPWGILTEDDSKSVNDFFHLLRTFDI